MRNYIVCSLFILFLFACKSKKKVIEIPKMKLIMWDMVTADALVQQQFALDSIIDSTKKNVGYYNKIFALNNVSKEEYFDSYNYYTQHPNEMKILLDSLAAFGVRMRDSATNKKFNK